MKKGQKVAAIGGAVTLVTMIAKLIVDLSIWRKGVAIRHTREWLIFMPFYASGVVTLTYALIITHEKDFLSWWGLLYFGVSLIAAMGTVWFLFDGFFQVGRAIISGKPELFPFFGLGSIDGKDDAKSDSFLRRYSPQTQKYLKITVLVLPIIAYIGLLIF